MPDDATTMSIVTPTLNAERYLAECLTSVHSQSWPGVEHLIIDGGSTDGTEAILRGSGTRWLSEPGLRQSAAINRGVRLARGEVIGWLNADDAYTPGSLRYISALFARDERLDVIIGDCEVVDASGKCLRILSPGPYDFESLLRKGNSIAQPAVFIRRRVFGQVGLLDETLEFGMDYDLWLRMRGLQVEYVPRVLAQFRWHVKSKTATSLNGSWEELLTIVRRYGGGWSPALAWAYTRAHLTQTRQQLVGGIHRRT